MCEISIANLGDEVLNKRAFLILGTIGSHEHKDGWGFAQESGEFWKCSLPMHWTSDSGKILAEKLKSEDGLLLGHIRKASPSVPITKENAHPFALEGITFVHNGKLVPDDDKNFVMEEEVPDLDKESKEQFDKDGNKKMKKVARSDSLIFFEEFIKEWQVEAEYASIYDKFVAVINATMKKFHGTFAMVFIIGGEFFIVRGKTKKLFMSFLTEKNEADSKVLGWLINTSDVTLNSSVNLLSNLNQIEGFEELHFSYPELLKEETIFVATRDGVEIIGEIKEKEYVTKTPKTYTPTTNAWAPATPVSKPSVSQNIGGDKEYLEMQEKIYVFLREYSLAPIDLQYLLFKSFGISMTQMNKEYARIFLKRIVPLLANYTNKNIKNQAKKDLQGYNVGTYVYDDSLQYPWVLNPKNVQMKLIRSLRGK